MTITLRVGILTATAVFIGRATCAQSLPPAGAEPQAIIEHYVDTRNGLSLADAVAHAIDHEPALRAARSEIEAARGMRTQATLRPNPSVSFERREQLAGTDNQTMVEVEWPLDLFRRTSRIAAADQEVVATERSVDERMRVLVGDVRQRYGDAAAAIRDLSIAGDVAAAMRRAFELLRQRVQEGAAPPLDRDRLDVELRRAETEQLLAQGRADAAMFQLRRAIGAGPDRPLMLRDTLETLAPAPITDMPSAESQVIPGLGVLQQRADIREAEARVAVADSRIERARDEGSIDVSLLGSYTRMNQGFEQLGFNTSGGLEPIRDVFHSLSVGAMVTIPLGSRNQGEIAAAQAERIGAAARLESTKLTAEAELASAAAQERQARRALALAEGSVRLARQNLDVVRQTYELGRATVPDVLAETRQYLDAERAYTNTLRMAYEARVALQRARGEQ